MLVTIGGTGGTDITQYIAYGGFKWQRNDIDGPTTGRTLDGMLIRDRLAVKERLDITCHPLTTAELAIVMALIEPEWVSVTYISPRTGGTVTKTMYSNNIPVSFLFARPDGTEYWGGVTFPLIEK